jgi:DNA primase
MDNAIWVCSRGYEEIVLFFDNDEAGRKEDRIMDQAELFSPEAWSMLKRPKEC